jgi:outer membrane receptor protein involved in Fe transport
MSEVNGSVGVTRGRAIRVAVGVHLAAVCLSPCCIETAAAQEAQLTGEADEARVAPDPFEVIVTATKRETKLQETPIAITAFTSEQIENQRLYN